MVWPPSEENFTCRYPSGVRQVLLALLFFPSLFHPHLLRLYILPVPLTLAIWFALINRGEYCWHRVFPASKFLCLPYVTPKSYCSNFMDECKAEITAAQATHYARFRSTAAHRHEDIGGLLRPPHVLVRMPLERHLAEAHLDLVEVAAVLLLHAEDCVCARTRESIQREAAVWQRERAAAPQRRQKEK